MDDIADYHAIIENSQVSGLQLNTGFTSLNVVASITTLANIKGGGKVEKGEAFIFRITSFNFYDTIAVKTFEDKKNAGFGNITLSDYVVFVIPDEIIHPDLLPTYWFGDPFWDGAETLELRENFLAVLTIQKTPEEGTGTGRVIGELFVEDGEGKVRH